jgi:P-type E1-E2 ATPase
MLPGQKKLLVKFIRKCFSFSPRVLAAGGKASNGAMLLEANVGVGVSTDATNQINLLGEYSVRKFYDLRVLILKHGRYNYLRISNTVLLFLYKNFVLALLLFSYIFYSDYSGEPVFEAGLIIFYNVLFTTLPVLVMGTFD